MHREASEGLFDAEQGGTPRNAKGCHFIAFRAWRIIVFGEYFSRAPKICEYFKLTRILRLNL